VGRNIFITRVDEELVQEDIHNNTGNMYTLQMKKGVVEGGLCDNDVLQQARGR
jgi:hypothetical protein